MSSETSAFGSPLSFGQTTDSKNALFGGFPSPSCYLTEREEEKMVSISARPAYKDKSHEELRWEHHHQFNAASLGGGVVPAFAGNNSACPSPVFPFQSNPFATKVTPPSIGQYPFLNYVPPSIPTQNWGVPPFVPSSPFSPVMLPSIGQYPFMNHVPPSVPAQNYGVPPSVPTQNYGVPPSVPSSPFSPVTPPFFRRNSFPNYVKKANIEFILAKMEELEKSTQFICKEVKLFQEDMKSWIERETSLELEKIEATQTISQLREELAHVTRSKDDIIAEYLASPAFPKRLDEEHEKRLSNIFHPCYVKALGAVQTHHVPEGDSFSSPRPATLSFPQIDSMSSYASGFGSQVGFGQSFNPNVSSTGSSGPQCTFDQASNLFGSAPNSGGTSTGLFGGSSFGQNSVFGGSSFGRSNLFGSAPNNGGTSTGVFGGSSFANHMKEASPDFTKRLDEEHKKRISKIFHPCCVNALGAVQTHHVPERDSFTSPSTLSFPQIGNNSLLPGQDSCHWSRPM